MPAPKGNDYAVGNDGGRETLFKAEYVEQAEKLSMLGATDIEIADFFGVDRSTLYRWKLAHEEFRDALKVGKEKADERVVSSLYHRALGYSHPDVDIRVIEGEIVQTELVKHYPPDTAAAIFWLKNRRKDDWRDKQEHEHSGQVVMIAPEASDL